MLLITKEIRAKSGNVAEKKGGRWCVVGGGWGKAYPALSAKDDCIDPSSVS
jgi:hypothetical protein